jgi:hypothetical protein
MPSSFPVVTPSPSLHGSVKAPTLDLNLRVEQAFVKVVGGESLRGKGLTASCILKMIKHRYAFRDASDFNVAFMNRVIGKVNVSVDSHTITNMTGQFRLRWYLDRRTLAPSI